MAEMLFVGGPLHGQVRDVKEERFTAPIPAGQRSLRDEGGIPILTSFDTVTYVPRKFASASGRYRRVMAVEAMPPGEVLQALADVLITIWVESGDLPEPALSVSAHASWCDGGHGDTPCRTDEEVAEELRDLLDAANARRTDAPE